ncbi:MAG: MipA/OmpV family protein [Psychrobium sp.]|nr:MipA/OmpV family protein [Psychrobium sp.]
MKNLTKSLLTGLIGSTLLLSSAAVFAHDEDKEHDEEHEHFNFNYEPSNPRDGFYLGISAISSTGDNFYLKRITDPETEFDVDVSYRVQFLGLFVESPGLSSRRIHGMYATPAWGINFFNNDDWSLDLFYETSTKSIEGLEGINGRRQDKRGGLRATGYFKNSQLQVIFTPYSASDADEDGMEASVSYGRNWQYKNWNIYADVGLQYRSIEVNDYYQAQTVAMDASDTSTGAGVSTSLELGLEYPLSENWVFGSFFAYQSLSDRTVERLSVDKDSGYRAGVLLTYVF